MRTIRTIAYIIIIYVAAFMIWWMVLLTRMEKEVFDLKKQNLIENAVETDEFEALKIQFGKDKRQILYEGVVFLVLLAGSSYYVIRGINRESKFNELKRNFLLATTHELKTPLSVTKLNLQTILTKNVKKEQQDKLLNNSLSEVNRLNQLVNNILLASKIDATDYSFGKEIINLNHSIHKLVNHHPQKHRVECLLSEGAFIAADLSAVEVILQNLLDNALKYSMPNERVVIETKNEGRNVVLQVADEGIGIPHGERKRIFERFYRVEDEQTRQTKGTGLGLFLVKEMVHQMKGKVQVSDNQPKGSIFTITLPACNDQSTTDITGRR